jgi:fructose-bisphosphate aldolase class I
LTRLGLENTPESRRAYREILYTAPRIGEAYSGVIMHPETLLQATSDGTPFVEVLARQGVLAGVKVDEGLAPLEGGEEGETETKGLEGLAAACQ